MEVWRDTADPLQTLLTVAFAVSGAYHRWLQRRAWQLWACRSSRLRVGLGGWDLWVSPPSSSVCRCSRWAQSWLQSGYPDDSLSLTTAFKQLFPFEQNKLGEKCSNKKCPTDSGWTCTWMRTFLRHCCCSPEPCIWLTLSPKPPSSRPFLKWRYEPLRRISTLLSLIIRVWKFRAHSCHWYLQLSDIFTDYSSCGELLKRAGILRLCCYL